MAEEHSGARGAKWSPKHTPPHGLVRARASTRARPSRRVHTQATEAQAQATEAHARTDVSGRPEHHRHEIDANGNPLWLPGIQPERPSCQRGLATRP